MQVIETHTKSLDGRDDQVVCEQLRNLGASARLARKELLKGADEHMPHRSTNKEAIGSDL